MRVRPLTVATVLWLTVLLPSQAAGQGLVTTNAAGEVAVDYNGRWLEKTSGTLDGHSRFREWLLFRTQGFFTDPRLLDFDVTLRPLLGQQTWPGSGSPGGTITRLDGAARVSAFNEHSIGLTAHALRLSEDQALRFGGDQAFDLAIWGGRLDGRWAPLPMRLEYRDESRRNVNRISPGRITELDQRWRRLKFDASNRKTRIELERLDLDDRIGPSDFRHNRADFNNTYRWGKGSRVTSQFAYLDRVGSGTVERINWRQSARIQHLRSMASEIGYTLFDQTAPDDFSRGWGTSYNGTWQVNQPIRLAFDAFAQARSFRLGDQSYARLRPRFEFNYGPSSAFRFRVSAGAGYEWHQQATSEDGFSTVVDERHVVDETAQFLLDQAFADPTSVVVKSEDASLVYEPGFDYRLELIGVFVGVAALPGGRLVPGVRVLVDYRFVLLPGGDANAWIYDYDVSVWLGPLTAYHRRSDQNETGSGPPTPIGTLQELDYAVTGFRLSGNTPVGNMSVVAEIDRRDARTFNSTGGRIRGTWRFLATSSVSGMVSAGWRVRENGDRFEAFEGESLIEWSATRSLRLGARFSAYDWEDGPVRRERFIGGGLAAEWRHRRLRFTMRWDHNAWTQANERTENRLLAFISRSF